MMRRVPKPRLGTLAVMVLLAVLSGCASVDFDQSLKTANKEAADFTQGKLALGRTAQERASLDETAGQLLSAPISQVNAVQLTLSNSPALQACLSGEVDFMLDTFGTSFSHYKSGKLRYLAICDEKRSALAPEVPTTGESGLPDVQVLTVNPVALPAATPPDIVAAIAVATRKIMSDEKLLADLRAMSIDPVGDADPVKSAAYFTKEMERWEPIIKATGAKME